MSVLRQRDLFGAAALFHHRKRSMSRAGSGK
jgi:hypothetical protein